MGFAFRFYDLGPENENAYNNFGLFLIWAGFLPIWIRFWQSINKLFCNKGAKIHYLNPIKYFGMIGIPVFLTFLSNGNSAKNMINYNLSIEISLIVFYVLGVFYSCFIDIYLDWGLLRCFNDFGKYGLREKITFKPWFYYFAVVLDIIIRF